MGQAGDIAELGACLAGECDGLRTCVEILQTEERCLMHGDVELLPQLAAQKAEVLAEISKQSALRERLVAQRGLPQGKAGMESLLEALPEFRPQWHEILEWTRRARDLNHMNGGMIHERLGRTRQAIAILTGGSGEALYGRDGHRQTGTSRTLGSA